MPDVAVAGVGMTRFTRQAERGHTGLAHEAIGLALADAGIRQRDVEAIFCGSVVGGSGIGQKCIKDLGFSGAPVTNIENACASSISALFEARAWVMAGLCDVALAFGVEILSPAPKGPLEVPKGNWLFDAGMNLPAWYAMRAREHMVRYGLTREQLAEVAAKSRKLGALNPKAHFQVETTVEDVLASRSISDPLTLFQCCPKTDGAAAAVVVSDRFVKRHGGVPIWIRGAALGTGTAVYTDRRASVGLPARIARKALEQANVGPSDLSLAEVHDAFSIGEILYSEALGLCDEGEGGVYAASGRSLPGGGGVAVNTSGGLLSRGHPLGASGLAMVNEVVDQLRGRSGKRQVDGARLGATHTMGANEFELDGNICGVFVFAK